MGLTNPKPAGTQFSHEHPLSRLGKASGQRGGVRQLVLTSGIEGGTRRGLGDPSPLTLFRPTSRDSVLPFSPQPGAGADSLHFHSVTFWVGNAKQVEAKQVLGLGRGQARGPGGQGQASGWVCDWLLGGGFQ